MEKHHWKRFSFVVVRGLLLTLLAVALHTGGYLTRLESLLRDERVIHCQRYRPRPTTSLVQLDVDDNALTYIGRWPWPPTDLARMIDEIARTKPRVMAMDVLFAEPKGIVYDKNGVGVDEDRVLGDAISRMGCGVVPISLKFESTGVESRVHRLLLPLLVEDPERTEARCLEMLRPTGITEADLSANPADSFLQIREQAFYERIWREVSALKDAPPDVQKIKHTMLPHADPRLTKTVLGDLVDENYDRVMREKTMLRYTLPLGDSESPLLNASDEVAPILPLGQSAAHSGFVDYLPESVEGTVRSVPLIVRYRDRMIPQMDLATACAYLGVDVQSIKLSMDTVTIPRPGGQDIVIPVSSRESTVVGPVGMLMEVPLFGRTNDWLTMYDFPKHEKPAQHLSAYEVWRICQAQDSLGADQKAEDDLLSTALNATGAPDVVKAFHASPPTGEAKRALVQKTLKDTSDFVHTLSADTDPDADTKLILQNVTAVDADLRLASEQIDKLELQLAQLRNKLYDELHDRSVFFGGTATGLQDLRPTSLIGECPGIVIHGAVYNAILTGKMWRMAKPMWGTAITAVMGLLTVLIVLRLAPLVAFVTSAALAVGYLAFNGYFLFDRENLIVAAAGPTVAVALVWAGMTLTNFLTEIAEKSRITKRFRSYVDPKIVNYVVDHPDHVRFDGEKRELTVCFSDLEGFTTLTDRIGEKIVPLLADYMGVMVPIIRKAGYVAQMSGDGIYFFFGAPEFTPRHAEFAVNTAIEMRKALAAFNITTVRERGYDDLAMRIGISTGEVIVGDTGPSNGDASSYTAMGATVNLSARLESANKVFGTRTLVTARTVELLNGSHLVRPIANVKVAGKLTSEIVYEPICRMAEATERDHKLTEFSRRLFDAYRKGNFNRCIAAAVEIEETFGPCKLAELYTRLSNQHLTGSLQHVEGQIVLTEK